MAISRVSRNFRFGVTMSAMTGRRRWHEQARLAADLGFDVLTMSDHFGDTGGVWGGLVSAHEAAPSLRLGTMVLNGDLMNPVHVARDAITTDLLSDGQFELGIGAGWLEADYRAAGVVRQPAAIRLARLGEALQILGQALAGRPVSFAGEYYTVDAPALPAPVQSRIPLVIGGGSRGILQLAGRHANTVSVHRNLERGVAASWSHELRADGLDPVSQKIEWVKEAAGDRFASIELHALILQFVISDRRAEALATLAHDRGLPVEYVANSPHFLVGSVDQVVEELTRRRERWGITFWTFAPGTDWQSFAPVIERLERQ